MMREIVGTIRERQNGLSNWLIGMQLSDEESRQLTEAAENFIQKVKQQTQK
jgi:hypothetical protein